MHHHYQHGYLLNIHMPCVVLGQGLPGRWKDRGTGEAHGAWPCLLLCSIKMCGFAEAIWLEGQTGAVGQLAFLVKDRGCFCKFFLSGAAPN